MNDAPHMLLNIASTVEIYHTQTSKHASYLLAVKVTNKQDASMEEVHGLHLTIPLLDRGTLRYSLYEFPQGECGFLARHVLFEMHGAGW